jgi:hypothetical protein
MQEGLIFNQELTLEEYQWSKDFTRKTAEYIVDHIADFYPEKLNNERWNKKSREDQIEDMLELYAPQFNREVKKESKGKPKEMLTDADYYTPSWKIKMVLNKDTSMPECNIYIQESDGSIRLLYAHPQPPLPFQLNQEDLQLRAKYIQDYKDSLIPFLENNKLQEFTANNLIPQFSEVEAAWDYLGISVTQGKWTHSTRGRQFLITKMPEKRENHVPGTIAPCLFQGRQVVQGLPSDINNNYNTITSEHTSSSIDNDVTMG